MTIKRPLKLLTGDPRTNRPIWIEHEEVTDAAADSPEGTQTLEAFLVVDGHTKLPMRMSRTAAMQPWSDQMCLYEVTVWVSLLVTGTVSSVDAKSAGPATAQAQEPVEVRGGQVQVDGGVEQVESTMPMSGAATDANLAEPDISVTAVGAGPTGGLACDDLGEEDRVDEMVPSFDADEPSDGETPGPAETSKLDVEAVGARGAKAVRATKGKSKKRKNHS